MQEKLKPSVKLIGVDGNVFNIIGRVRRALYDAGLREKATEYMGKVGDARSYGRGSLPVDGVRRSQVTRN